MTERISTFHCHGCQSQVLEATLFDYYFWCDKCTLERNMPISHYDPYPKTKEADD